MTVRIEILYIGIGLDGIIRVAFNLIHESTGESATHLMNAGELGL